jgi:hypothetical protein
LAALVGVAGGEAAAVKLVLEAALGVAAGGVGHAGAAGVSVGERGT